MVDIEDDENNTTHLTDGPLKQSDLKKYIAEIYSFL